MFRGFYCLNKPPEGAFCLQRTFWHVCVCVSVCGKIKYWNRQQSEDKHPPFRLTFSVVLALLLLHSHTMNLWTHIHTHTRSKLGVSTQFSPETSDKVKHTYRLYKQPLDEVVFRKPMFLCVHLCGCMRGFCLTCLNFLMINYTFA